MATHTKGPRAAGAFVLAIALTAAGSSRAHAGDLTRIRTELPVLSTMMTDAFDRSATFRVLVERIEQSDVIVYLTCERFDDAVLSGRTALAAAPPGARYVRVELQCQQSAEALIAILAHELQHVVEIASTPTVVDHRSFARLFSKIGFPTCRSPWDERFETMAALHTGERVRWELFHRRD